MKNISLLVYYVFLGIVLVGCDTAQVNEDGPGNQASLYDKIDRNKLAAQHDWEILVKSTHSSMHPATITMTAKSNVWAENLIPVGPGHYLRTATASGQTGQNSTPGWGLAFDPANGGGTPNSEIFGYGIYTVRVEWTAGGESYDESFELNYADADIPYDRVGSSMACEADLDIVLDNGTIKIEDHDGPSNCNGIVRPVSNKETIWDLLGYVNSPSSHFTFPYLFKVTSNKGSASSGYQIVIDTDEEYVRVNDYNVRYTKSNFNSLLTFDGQGYNGYTLTGISGPSCLGSNGPSPNSSTGIAFQPDEDGLLDCAFPIPIVATYTGAGI